MLSYACGGMFYALLGIAICGTAGVPVLSAWSAFLFVTLVLMTALIMATLRRPSVKEVAKRVDHTYQLQQRCETALECLTHHDAFSLLLHRDAFYYLQRIDPAQLLPYKMSAGSKTLFLVALMVWGLAAGIRFTGFPQERIDLTGLRPRSPTRGQEQARETIPGTASTTARTVSQRWRNGVTTRQSHTAAGSQISTPRSPARPAPAKPAVATSGVASPSPAQQPGNQTRADRLPADAHGNRRAMGQTSKSETNVVPSRHHPWSRNEPISTTNAITRQADNVTSSQSRASIRQESGRGPGTTRHATRGQPGKTVAVQDGKGASQPSALPVLDAHDRPPLSRRHRLPEPSWNAGEDALARERIPPGFRNYIRDYFVAVHPKREAPWRP